MEKNLIFNELFVLELANNHWGRLSRGLKIIKDYGHVVKKNNIKATIKFQFRDVKKFIHPDYFLDTNNRYIDKTRKTMMSWNDMGQMIKEVSAQGMLTMATPFDEFSIYKCMEFNLDLIKIASSDIKDKSLVKKIGNIGKPVIVSSGGANLSDLDWVVKYFQSINTPLALNHCVSLYPSEDHQLQLNQIDLLKKRYPEITIGFSSHEYKSWDYSMMIAYAKGARTFERHIDIDFESIPVSKYCSLPEQIDTWFKAFNKVKEFCGSSSDSRRTIEIEESNYLDKLVRGVYVNKDIKHNITITLDDIFLAIPKLKGQLSCQDFIKGIILGDEIKKGEPILKKNILSLEKKNIYSSKNLVI
jgi:N-acetylneuraminate synthase